MVRICFLIRQLNEGGAQRQLLELAKQLDKSKCSITILTFYEGGLFSSEVRRIGGVNYINLKKRGRWDIVGFLFRLVNQLRQVKPNVLYGYLGGANLLTVAVRQFLPETRIVWGVRSSNVDLSRYDWLSRITYRCECVLARFADLIIVNSNAGREYHREHGFPDDKMVVIPNGINTDYFKPDAESRKRVRAEWGVSEKEDLIGLVGRLDPMKDHPTFIRAGALLAETRRNVRFVFVGDGPEGYRQQLLALCRELGIAERSIWVGVRADMAAVYNALDIVTSSSAYGEGFPNVVGEAMACGVPCVVTDVGDSAWIVGDTGVVVPPKNPQALAAGWQACLSRTDSEIAVRARQRIVGNCSIQQLVERTEHAIWLKA